MMKGDKCKRFDGIPTIKLQYQFKKNLFIYLCLIHSHFGNPVSVSPSSQNVSQTDKTPHNQVGRLQLNWLQRPAPEGMNPLDWN